MTALGRDGSPSRPFASRVSDLIRLNGGLGAPALLRYMSQRETGDRKNGWAYISPSNIPVSGLPLYYASVVSGRGATASRPFETEAGSRRVFAKIGLVIHTPMRTDATQWRPYHKPKPYTPQPSQALRHAGISDWHTVPQT